MLSNMKFYHKMIGNRIDNGSLVNVVSKLSYCDENFSKKIV